jgi:hypothetical protein
MNGAQAWPTTLIGPFGVTCACPAEAMIAIMNGEMRIGIDRHPARVNGQ